MAIARIFLNNLPILILDEATSALDSHTEAAIQRSLSELAAGRTTLVIAHRLATIRDADRTVVVTPAGMAEQGSHGELMRAVGLYQALYEVQRHAHPETRRRIIGIASSNRSSAVT